MTLEYNLRSYVMYVYLGIQPQVLCHVCLLWNTTLGSMSCISTLEYNLRFYVMYAYFGIQPQVLCHVFLLWNTTLGSMLCMPTLEYNLRFYVMYVYFEIQPQVLCHVCLPWNTTLGSMSCISTLEYNLRLYVMYVYHSKNYHEYLNIESCVAECKQALLNFKNLINILFLNSHSHQEFTMVAVATDDSVARTKPAPDHCNFSGPIPVLMLFFSCDRCISCCCKPHYVTVNLMSTIRNQNINSVLENNVTKCVISLCLRTHFTI